MVFLWEVIDRGFPQEETQSRVVRGPAESSGALWVNVSFSEPHSQRVRHHRREYHSVVDISRVDHEKRDDGGHRELPRKNQRPTGTDQRQPSGGSFWLAALPPWRSRISSLERMTCERKSRTIYRANADFGEDVTGELRPWATRAIEATWQCGEACALWPWRPPVRRRTSADSDRKTAASSRVVKVWPGDWPRVVGPE